MKNLFTFLIVFICFKQTTAQSNWGQPKDSVNFEVKINPDFFLLGTFSDYMGRFQYIDRENQIDRYYPYEESLAKYINSFIFQNYNSKCELKLEKTRNSELFNSELAKQLHREYFDEKGNFIDEKLDTEEEKYSFLLGVYLRYGQHLDDNIYKIQVANSPKDKQLYRILKDLESDKIVYKFLRGYIPSPDIFYFVATPRMIKYFNIIEKEYQELNRARIEQTYGKLFESEQGKQLKEKFETQEKELIKSLKLVFN